MALEKIPVDICGVPVTVETDIDPIEMQAIAKYVEEKINESKNTSTEQTLSKIIILACLNIASELFRLRTNYDNLGYSINKKAEELIAQIDPYLDN